MSDSDRASPERAALIIEDDEATATRLQAGLLDAGYVVRRAGSAEEAIDSLTSKPADLILMNLMLPDADGLILCHTLMATFPVPIILLSPSAREVDRALAIESGALALLTLPIDTPTLLAQIRAAVQEPVSANIQPG